VVRAEVPDREAAGGRRGERAGGDLAHRLAARGHRAPWTGDAGLEQLHHAQALGRALRLAPPALLDADEPALEVAGPRQARLDRGPLAREVLAVERVADLQAERVAGGEPRGLGRVRPGHQPGPDPARAGHRA